MKKIVYAITVVLAAGLISCKNTPNLEKDQLLMDIQAQKVPCTGVSDMECLKVKIQPSSEWTYLYEDIKGFDYEPGYSYSVIVKENKRKEPIPADAGSTEYVLVKIVSKEK